VKALREEGFNVIGLFYNPNIHPYAEFQRRREIVLSYSKIALLPVHFDDDYDLKTCLKGMMEAEQRCLFCYEMRMRRLCEKGQKLGIERVSTTLLYSKFQRHEEIRSVGERVSKDYGIIFLYRDFRKGWRQGVDESRRLNMYRQSYCGCIFSEFERFGR